MEFNLVDFVISIRTDNRDCAGDILRLLGSGLSSQCRSKVCGWIARDCDCCSGRTSCNWYTVFSQELARDREALRCHQKPPLPFVFSLSAPEEKGGGLRQIECRLVVIGRAISCLDMLLEGVASILGQDNKHQYEILQLASRDYQGVMQPLLKTGRVSLADNLAVLSAVGILESQPWNSTRLGIKLLSPLKLLADGRQLRKFDFSTFARSLLRRVSSLAYYYGECEADFDFKALSRQAETIICTQDNFSLATFSNRKLSGITGHGVFSGDFSGLMPFLVLGTYVQAGKSVTYGMGRYELLSEKS